MSPFKSSTGLDENIAGALCYFFGFIGAILLLALEKRSRFVMFHALQSLFAFGAIVVGHVLSGLIPLLGPLLASLLSLLGVAIWVIMLAATLQGKWLKLPVVGDLAEKQMRKL
ncbi:MULTISPECIES: hypothetical protein [unclassified Paenibacillus]|uniref:DUF4870 domain-containing protein n=1 Tax=Paenibacillus provencensis TaxID=441151 RepID=A0ABW3PZ35_9BACL|nr:MULTISPECIES: hypothetical protein [unclassified Paenibacillus]MCM3129374.1 hypothetical protein [Paenibacillus sp. MER 78]SFS72292.1 Uncharacterized membrane protein [Paenibacillus sp. 453mf]